MKLGRDKIALIRGWAKIAPEITISEYERINADYIALITALKYPQLLPEEYCGFEADPTSIYTSIKKIMDHWCILDSEHFLSSEYANCVVDRAKEKIKAVEGQSLEVDWFYNTVKNYHRNLGQVIIECEVFYDRDTTGGIMIRIDGKDYRRDEAVSILKPSHFLG